MGSAEVVTATIFTLGLVGAVIGLYIKMVTDAALATQKQIYLKEQVDKLELRVNEIEDNAVMKIDKIQESIHKIEINIGKILNK